MARSNRLRAPRREGLLLKRGSDGQLWARQGETARAVRVTRCFPWSEPSRYLSLRDGDDEEVALIRDLAELGSDSRHALAESLIEAGFVLIGLYEDTLPGSPVSRYFPPCIATRAAKADP